MDLKIKLRADAIMPTRAHDTDAGLDIYTPAGFTLSGMGSEIIATGVHVEVPKGHVGMLKSKSGLNIKHGIISEGVIDEGFTGEIVVKLYNLSKHPRYFQRGDMITQLVIMPVAYPTPVQVDEISGGERGANGFGSTGR